MISKKHKLRFNNAPHEQKKPRETPGKQNLGKLFGAAVLLSACSKKDAMFDTSSPRIVTNEDGTQTVVGLKESMIRPYKEDSIQVDALDVAYIAAFLLILRFSKIQPSKKDKTSNEDRG